MIRLFIDSDLSEQQKVLLQTKQAHYLTHVMRLKDGDKVDVFNGRQGLWLSEIKAEKKQFFLRILSQKKEQKKLPECILCPSLIKKEPMDMILQKATELGVTHIYPITSERSVVHQLNMERAQNILYEACEQCERLDIPVLHTPQKLAQILDILRGKADLIWLSERGKTDKKSSSLPPALFVGPEGGWTEQEQALFEKYHVQQWHLGYTILRSETACLAGLALCINKNE